MQGLHCLETALQITNDKVNKRINYIYIKHENAGRLNASRAVIIIRTY